MNELNVNLNNCEYKSISSPTELITPITYNNGDISDTSLSDQDELISNIKSKVLIIGLDGTRPDCLNNISSPNIYSLLDYSIYTLNGLTGDICWSGPGWSSLFTGVWRNKHGVNGNEETFEKGEERIKQINSWPDLMSRIKKLSNNRISTASIVNWQPLNIDILHNIDLAKGYPNNDNAITEDAIKILNDKYLDIDLLFVHLDDIDHAGHEYDYCTNEYYKAITITDNRVKQILNSLNNRPNINNEDWLVILTTDHGGKDKTHEIDIPENRTIFIILTKFGHKAKLLNCRQLDHKTIKPEIVDIYPTILKHFGFDIDTEWQLDGKPLI